MKSVFLIVLLIGLSITTCFAQAPPGPFNLLYPDSEATNIGYINLSLRWQRSSEAARYDGEIRIADFSEESISLSTSGDTSVIVNLHSNTRYRWRVVAWDTTEEYFTMNNGSYHYFTTSSGLDRLTLSRRDDLRFHKLILEDSLQLKKDATLSDVKLSIERRNNWQIQGLPGDSVVGTATELNMRLGRGATNIALGARKSARFKTYGDLMFSGTDTLNLSYMHKSVRLGHFQDWEVIKDSAGRTGFYNDYPTRGTFFGSGWQFRLWPDRSFGSLHITNGLDINGNLKIGDSAPHGLWEVERFGMYNAAIQSNYTSADYIQAIVARHSTNAAATVQPAVVSGIRIDMDVGGDTLKGGGTYSPPEAFGLDAGVHHYARGHLPFAAAVHGNVDVLNYLNIANDSSIIDRASVFYARAPSLTAGSIQRWAGITIANVDRPIPQIYAAEWGRIGKHNWNNDTYFWRSNPHTLTIDSNLVITGNLSFGSASGLSGTADGGVVYWDATTDSVFVSHAGITAETPIVVTPNSSEGEGPFYAIKIDGGFAIISKSDEVANGFPVSWMIKK